MDLYSLKETLHVHISNDVLENSSRCLELLQCMHGVFDFVHDN